MLIAGWLIGCCSGGRFLCDYKRRGACQGDGNGERAGPKKLHAEFSLQKGLQFVEQEVGFQQRRVSRFALQGEGGACTKADEITCDNHSQ
jgi:hypothetical protein